MGWHYLWWVPAVLIFNLIYAWLSLKNSSDTGWLWFFIIYAFGFIQLWAVISKITPKEAMVFNAVLYDITMLVGFQLGLILLGAAAKFNWVHWSGLSIVLVGFTILKLGDFK